MSNILRTTFSRLSEGTCFTTGGYFAFIFQKVNFEYAEIVGCSDPSERYILMDPEDVVSPVFQPSTVETVGPSTDLDYVRECAFSIATVVDPRLMLRRLRTKFNTYSRVDDLCSVERIVLRMYIFASMRGVGADIRSICEHWNRSPAWVISQVAQAERSLESVVSERAGTGCGESVHLFVTVCHTYGFADALPDALQAPSNEQCS